MTTSAGRPLRVGIVCYPTFGGSGVVATEIGLALAGAPRLILFDEPAAGLSPAERRALVALLSAFPPHMGYVLIEHDLDIALRVVERVTILHSGRLLKHGTPDEIENDAEVQAIYMGGKHGGGHGV